MNVWGCHMYFMFANEASVVCTEEDCEEESWWGEGRYGAGDYANEVVFQSCGGVSGIGQWLDLCVRWWFECKYPA
jgi:hypothetical protein